MDDRTKNILRRNAAWVDAQKEALLAAQAGIASELSRICRADGRSADPAEAFGSVFPDGLCSASFARFCREYAKGQTEPAMLASLLPESAVEEDEPDNALTAYMRNPYSDRAFSVFSDKVTRLSAQYHPSFAAVCEEVYYGRCNYCILPFQTPEDGMLSSFFRMAEKHDLKISAACDIGIKDENTSIRFALLRRGLSLDIQQQCFFQATVILPPDIPPGKFLAACEETGASIERITTFPLSYTNEIASFSICFRISPTCFAPLLLFLRSVLENYSPDGIYALLQ